MSQDAIWKFVLQGGENNHFFADMPAGAVLLSVGSQHREFVAWAIVTPGYEPVRRWIHIAGTGHPLPINLRPKRYLGRVEIQTEGQLLQFHPFEMTEAPHG